MVSDVIESTTATEAEIAAAAQEAQDTLQRQQVKDGERVTSAAEIPGSVKPLQYRVPAQDQGSWVMVWELKLDQNGDVYGDPTRAPRQQLGLWLQKKREGDGGQRFTVDMPARLRAEATIPCLYNGPEMCRKKFYTRQDMVEHIYGTHPRFSRINEKLLEGIMAKVAEDNPRLAQMAEAIANMGDRGMVSVEVNPTPRTDRVDVTVGVPTVQSFGISPSAGCAACDWTYKEGWSDAQKAQFLHTHTLAKHKDDI